MEVPMKKRKRIPLIAAVLSLVAPGLGQLYNGQILKGICFFLADFSIPILLLLARLQYQFYGLVVILIITICLWLFIIGEAFFTAKRKKEFVLKGYNKWYVYLLIIFLMYGTYIIPKDFIAGITSESIGFSAYKMGTGSMEPTLLFGDYLRVNTKYFKRNKIQRGDLILFKYPKEPTKLFIQRVIATEGEKIEIRDKQVYVNDRPIKEEYKIHRDSKTFARKEFPNFQDMIRDNYGPTVVLLEHCFVLGDNRENSYDSRYWGFLPLHNVKGKPLYVYWAKDKNRIGKKIR